MPLAPLSAHLWKSDEVHNERRATDSDDGITEYVRTWRVFTRDPQIGPRSVIDYAFNESVITPPTFLDVYQDANGVPDINAKCVRIEPQQDQDDPRVWLIRYTFTTDQLAVEPLLVPPVVRWSTEKYQIPAVKDRFGKAIVNAAGEMFDPPPLIEKSRNRLLYTRNEASPLLTNFDNYINRVNSTPFWGNKYPEKTVYLYDVTRELQYHGKYVYWQVTYEFHIRLETWDLNVLNAGYKHLENDIAVLNRDPKDFTPLAFPVPLNANGTQLVFNPLLPIGGQLVYLDFEVYDQADFDDFGLAVIN